MKENLDEVDLLSKECKKQQLIEAPRGLRRAWRVRLLTNYSDALGEMSQVLLFTPLDPPSPVKASTVVVHDHLCHLSHIRDLDILGTKSQAPLISSHPLITHYGGGRSRPQYAFS